MRLLLVLLLAVGTAAAPHVNFLQFSQNGKPSGVRSAIGYPIEVLEFAWRKYGSRLIRAGADDALLPDVDKLLLLG